jgi:hypothetical protein
MPILPAIHRSTAIAADEVTTAMEVANEEEADSDSSMLPPDIGCLLSVRGQRPVEYWMRITMSFRDAFEILIEQPWVDEFDYLFAATIYGVRVEWHEHVTRAIRYSWGNHIVFITLAVDSPSSASSFVTRASLFGIVEEDANGDTASSASDEPLNNGILMAIRGDAPAVYRVPSHANYREAFATLTAMPWMEEYENYFCPMVDGRTMSWLGLLGALRPANIIYHRLSDLTPELGEWVLDVIPQTPGADHPVWQAAVQQRIGDEQRNRDEAARARYEAEVGSNGALPSRGFERWSPTGSISDEDCASTAAASDIEE